VTSLWYSAKQAISSQLNKGFRAVIAVGC